MPNASLPKRPPPRKKKTKTITTKNPKKANVLAFSSLLKQFNANANIAVHEKAIKNIAKRNYFKTRRGLENETRPVMYWNAKQQKYMPDVSPGVNVNLLLQLVRTKPNVKPKNIITMSRGLVPEKLKKVKRRYMRYTATETQDLVREIEQLRKLL